LSASQFKNSLLKKIKREVRGRKENADNSEKLVSDSLLILLSHPLQKKSLPCQKRMILKKKLFVVDAENHLKKTGSIVLLVPSGGMKHVQGMRE
jgi:hypothetical protein